MLTSGLPSGIIRIDSGSAWTSSKKKILNVLQKKVDMPDIKVEVVSGQGKTGGDLAPRIMLPESLKERVSELGESISEIANGLRAEIDRRMEASGTAQWDLDTVEMSFSLDLEAEAGVVVTRAKTSAGFEVTLTWKRTAQS